MSKAGPRDGRYTVRLSAETEEKLKAIIAKRYPSMTVGRFLAMLAARTVTAKQEAEGDD